MFSSDWIKKVVCVGEILEDCCSLEGSLAARSMDA